MKKTAKKAGAAEKKVEKKAADKAEKPEKVVADLCPLFPPSSPSLPLADFASCTGGQAEDDDQEEGSPCRQVMAARPLFPVIWSS